MVEYSGSIGPQVLWGLYLRNRSEIWAADIIRQYREGRIAADPALPLAVIAEHEDLNGEPLTAEVAAGELLNLLRPIVAIGRFIVFAALALHRNPWWRDAFAAGDDADLEPFVQEVRRFYPFFPVIGGRVMNGFSWQDYDFDEGRWVLLDLYGTNHDAGIWTQPEEFRPERFRSSLPAPFSLVPQGGGDYHHTHRCPGEWITIALMKEAVHILSTGMDYDVPEQDLTIRLNQMPALPRSGFVMTGVKPIRAELNKRQGRREASSL